MQLVAVLVCGGIFAASQPKMLFGSIRKSLQSRVDRGVTRLTWLWKPLLLCYICTASIWGSVAYWLVARAFEWHKELWTLICWPMVILGTAFVNYLFSQLITVVNIYIQNDANAKRTQVQRNNAGQGPV